MEHIAREDPQGHIYALVQPKMLKDAQKHAAGLEGAKLELLTGDVVDMHLGLSGEEYQRLCEQVTDVFHLAAISHLSAPKETAWRVNVDGTRNMLELARDCQKLRRFNYFSTCYVSGDRLGVIAEDELDRGQSFRNPYEETKFQAEKLVQRAAATLPVTVFRPCSVVGDSRTGEIDRFEGPYYLGILLVTSPLVVPLPLPGNGVAPLNVVPVDYVVSAVWHLSRDPRGAGRTFHLVDPNPMSARRVYELIAEKANRKLPRFSLPVARRGRHAAPARAGEAGPAPARRHQLRQPPGHLQLPQHPGAAGRHGHPLPSPGLVPGPARRLRARAVPQAAREPRGGRPARSRARRQP